MGLSVALLGADGVGKTSVASELAKLLGANIIKTPGPAWDGLRKLAEQIPPTGRFMFYAAAVATSVPVIRRSLLSGNIIWDRGIQCTIAFHSAMGVDIPQNLPALLDIPEPDISIHLTVNPEEARRRISARANEVRPDAVIEENSELQAKVVEAYRNLNSFGLTGNFIPVEISTDGKTPPQVAQEIFEVMRERRLVA